MHITMEKIIYDLHIKRSLIQVGHKIIDKANNKDNESDGINQIEEAEENLFNLSQAGNYERKYFTFNEALKDAVDTIDLAFKKDGKIAGIATGLNDLDLKLGGLHNSDLTIIAGRPSMGKTALGTTIAFNIAKMFKEEKK